VSVDISNSNSNSDSDSDSDSNSDGDSDYKNGKARKEFDLEVYDLFMDVFDLLPISAKISDRYFCMHGGISPKL